MSTPNLAIAHVLPTQNNKTVTINAGLDQIDTVIAGSITEAMSDADFTVPTADALAYMAFKFTGALTAVRNVIVPLVKKIYLVQNATTGGQDILFKTVSVGGGVIISPNTGTAGGFVAVYCDGTYLVPLFAPQSWDITVFAPGVGTNNQVLYYAKMNRPFIAAQGAGQSIASAKIAATASTTFTLKKNGSAFATVNYAIGATAGVFTQAAQATFAATDALEIDGPAVADATLAGVSINLNVQRL
jgi:hypothetical protein